MDIEEAGTHERKPASRFVIHPQTVSIGSAGKWLRSDMAQDFVHDAAERLGCIHYDATGDVFFRGV